MTVTAGRSTVSPTRESLTMTVGEFLLQRIREAGVGHAFGVPGDYNLELLQQLEDTGTLEWIGTCNELNASYAADGYARLNGMAALIVTNAVGALSAINGVAGSYSEHVPVICVCGSIPFRSMERGLGMHHTMADGTWDRFLNAYAQVTAAQARLTPDNAVTEIDRLILTAWRDKLPVYMELPSDIGYLDIEVPAAPLVLEEPPSDPERLQSCTAAIAGWSGQPHDVVSQQGPSRAQREGPWSYCLVVPPARAACFVLPGSYCLVDNVAASSVVTQAGLVSPHHAVLANGASGSINKVPGTLALTHQGGGGCVAGSSATARPGWGLPCVGLLSQSAIAGPGG